MFGSLGQLGELLVDAGASTRGGHLVPGLLLFLSLAFVRLQHLLDVLECVDLLFLQEVGDLLWSVELGRWFDGRGLRGKVLARGGSVEFLAR